FPEHMSKDYYDFYVDYFFKVDPSIGYFPGAQEMLDELKRRGYKLAIATGKARRGLARFNDRLGLDKTFDDTICVDESASKPDPLMIDILLERQGATKEEAILIGDSAHDGQTAINACVDFMAVTFGARSEEEMKAFNPAFIAHSFDEILNYLSVSAQEEERSQATSEG
ncbi:MAG: HAD-IA family hydrolase, partial [Burkholderiales bacterium]|nr:HAD-IA family hydrolase [Burkholderiales bacterium]